MSRAIRHSRGAPACWLTAALLLAATPAGAAVTFSLGAGSAVGTADRVASFDGLNANGLDLTSYSEDSLFVTVADQTFVSFDPFNEGSVPTDGFHYGTGGNNSWVSIRATDATRMFAVEYRHGDGFTGSFQSHLRWATFRDGGQTGTGAVVVDKGVVVGFSDPNGFDELRVMAANDLLTAPEFGGFQAIALDTVRVDLDGTSNILDVEIDVLPGQSPNDFDPDALGKFAVALLGSEVFPPGDVVVPSIRVGDTGNGIFAWAGTSTEDVDGDETDDLVVWFRIEESGVSNGDSELCVSGNLVDERFFRGCDAIVTPGIPLQIQGVGAGGAPGVPALGPLGGALLALCLGLFGVRSTSRAPGA